MIVSKKPTFSEDRVFTEAQLARQQALREANTYGKAMKRDPFYVQLAESADRKAYHVAVADWLCAPKILEVDLSRWADGSGGPIRVRAQDDVKVVRVKAAYAWRREKHRRLARSSGNTSLRWRSRRACK